MREEGGYIDTPSQHITTTNINTNYHHECKLYFNYYFCYIFTTNKMTELTIEQKLALAISSVPNEDPVPYFNSMYKSINPLLIQEAVRVAKKELQKENKKNGKPVNVYLTLGSDGNTRSLYTGLIGGLLWLFDYIDLAGPSFGVSATDMETTKKVLRAIKLPQVFDAKFNEQENKLEESSSCRHYATFMASFVAWLTNGTTLVTCKNKLRTNLELTRFLTGLALNSFPSIPFTAYYIGSIKSNDMMELAEKLSRIVDFNKYMTPESITLNQPKFVVQNESAPLVGISGHPLANTILGQENNGNVEWFGLFQESDEFTKLCQKAGITSRDVKKYIYQTTEEEHAKNLEKGDKVAQFIQQQTFTRDLFELRAKNYGIDKTLEEDEGGDDVAGGRYSI